MISIDYEGSAGGKRKCLPEQIQLQFLHLCTTNILPNTSLEYAVFNLYTVEDGDI